MEEGVGDKVDPQQRTRNHDVEHGVIEIDFRTLGPGDAEVIAEATRQYLT